MQKSSAWPVTTDRLLIRWGTINDLAAIDELLTDDELVRLSGMQLPLDVMMRQWALGNWLQQKKLLVIFEHHEQLIGLIGLFPIYAENGEPQTDTLEIGYLLKQEHWGRQIMPEALTRVLPVLRETLHLKRVLAVVAEDNSRSQRVLQKLNFRPQTVQAGYQRWTKNW